MSNAIPKTAIELSQMSLAWDEDEIGEARAIQRCLHHLLRDAQELNLDMTARVLTAAMEAVDADIGRRSN